MTKWEYTYLLGGAGKSDLQRLNDLGLQGWEAVNYVFVPGFTQILLKRPL